MTFDAGRAAEGLRSLAEDPSFRAQFLPETTPDETAAIERLLHPVVEGAEAWCAEHPLIQSGPILPVTLLMCVQFPTMDLAGTLLRVKAVLWVFAIDDFLDGVATPPNEAATVSLECRTVASSPPGEERVESDYGDTLLQVKRSLAQCPAFSALSAIWSCSLARMLDGMMFEYWIRQRNAGDTGSLAIPTLQEYLYYGCNSIGLPFVWFTGLIVHDSMAASTHSLLQLSRVADECGVAMRLANDVRSYRSEERSGKVSSVHVIAESTNIDQHQAESAIGLVKESIRASCQRARVLVEGSGGARPIAERFVRATEWGVDLYQRSDFRAFGTG